MSSPLLQKDMDKVKNIAESCCLSRPLDEVDSGLSWKEVPRKLLVRLQGLLNLGDQTW